MSVIEARHLTRAFPMPAGPVTAVRDVSLRVPPGDFVALCGPSGCGKSTLLHLLGVVDSPTSGTLLFDGQDVATLGDTERSRIRLRKIGFVFQRFFLLPMLSAAENVELPMAEAGVARGTRTDRVRDLLSYVGLSARASHRPSQLSGGEMQRIAIARALANSPRLLLADEPTGNLDEQSGAGILDTLCELNRRDGLSIVLVTHDAAIARRADRIVRLAAGRVEPGRVETA